MQYSTPTRKSGQLSVSTQASIKDDKGESTATVTKLQNSSSTKATLDHETTLSTKSAVVDTDISVKTLYTADNSMSTKHATQWSSNVSKQTETLSSNQSSSRKTRFSTDNGSILSTSMSAISNLSVSPKEMSTLPHGIPGPSKTSVDSVSCKYILTSMFTQKHNIFMKYTLLQILQHVLFMV